MSERSLQPGTLLLTLLPVLLVVVPLGVWLHTERVEELRTVQLERATATAERTAARLRIPVINEDRAQAEQRLETLRQFAAFDVAIVRDHRGRTLARSSRETIDTAIPWWQPWISKILSQQPAAKHALELEVAIPLHETDAEETTITASAGTLEFNMLPLAEQPTVLRERGQFMAVFLAAIAALLAFATCVARWLSAPIQQLAVATEHLVDGRKDVELPTANGGAIGDAAIAIQTLSERLEQSRGSQTSQIQRATEKLQSDVDRLRTHNTELQAARRDHERSDRSKATHVAHISQTLRQPLTTLVGFIDLLERTSLSKEQRDYVRTLQRSSAHLLENMNNLLDWSREDGEQLRDRDIGFHIHDLLEDLVQTAASTAYAKGLDIQIVVYHDVPLRVTGHPVWLSHALSELLVNAIENTDAGRITIRVSLERHDAALRTLCFSVEDTGPGIAEDQRERLRELLAGSSVQAAGAVRKKLGLAVTRNLTQLMGGELSIDSESGRGTTASFTLTLRSDDARNEQRVVWDGLRGRTVWILEPKFGAARSPLTHLLEEWGIDVQFFDDSSLLNQQLRRADTALPDALMIAAMPNALDDGHIASILEFCAGNNQEAMVLLSSLSADVLNRAQAMGAAAAMPRCVTRDLLYQKLRLLVQPAATRTAVKPLHDVQILLADNSRANRRYIRSLLESLGARVTEAQDGQQAVAFASATTYPVILMDARMPLLSGADATEWIKAQHSDETAPVVIGISAYVDPDERRELLEAGMNDVLIKPFDESTLLQCLAAWIPVHSNPADAHTPQTVTSPLTAQKPNAPPADLLGLLEAELPTQLEQLEECIDCGDMVAAREAAHTLHGTAAFYQLDELRHAARRLEMELLRTQNDDTDTNRTLSHLHALQQAMHNAIADIAARLAAAKLNQSDE